MGTRVLKMENPREIFEKEGKLFDHISAMYERSRGFEHYWQNRRKNLILREMRLIGQGKTRSLLDVGCAEGFFARKAINFGFKLVVALDVSEVKLKRALKYARAYNMEIYHVLGSAEALPFKNDIFDLVLLSRVLEHVPKEELCLKEVHRVTRSFLILTVPSAHPTILSYGRMLKRREIIIVYPWGVQARLYYFKSLVKKLSGNWKIGRAFGVAPFSRLIAFISWRLKKHPSLFRKLDKVLEGKPLFRFLGHDIFILCQK